MNVPFRLRLGLVASLLAGPAAAQDPARGAMLYLQLPGGQPSCVECHGPDPQGDRNRLLTAASGPGTIALAITKVGAMGYWTSGIATICRPTWPA
jgi:mono/diheme cytochrome c family protein